MKRLIFCFDGTWNKLRPDLATNVVLTAASIERIARDGVAQIIHYDEGVGTGQLDQMRGGMFGTGLIDNLREAYRFLIFNYDPGDEIFVFGFSRGAYCARSFVGFIRHVGPLRRLHAGRIDEALVLYENRKAEDKDAVETLLRFRAAYSDGVCIGAADDDWRCANTPGYAAGTAPQMRIQYLGVWDTVGALGVPEILPLSGWLNREHVFHDAGLTDFVRSARHAVAIDEQRRLFPPVLFGDLTRLNEAAGFRNDDADAPFQERWFPGVHGSVGGGGDIRGLSDDALAWILKGAKQAGLALDTNAGTRIHGINPDPLASLVNERKPQRSATQMLKKPRVGPRHLWQLSASAIRRWRASPDMVAGGKYRPETLASVAEELDALGPAVIVVPTDLVATEIVRPGDSLSIYAKRHYGNRDLWPEILKANEGVITDEDDIFPGQTIQIPRLPNAGAST